MLTKGKYTEVFEILKKTIDSFPNNPSIPAIYMLKAQTHFLINRKRDEFLNLLNEIVTLFQIHSKQDKLNNFIYFFYYE